MKLKNKYSKQIIYSNQKFEDQIWYNQQIMTFQNFSQVPESVFRWPTFLMRNKHRKVWKVISRKPLSEKQTQPKEKTLSWKPNKIFLWPESVFRWPESVSVDRKVFPLTNFLNGKQTQKSLESGFPETIFQETNMASVFPLKEKIRFKGYKYPLNYPGKKFNFLHLKNINSIQEQLCF